MTLRIEPSGDGFVFRLHETEVDLLVALRAGLEATLDTAQPDHPVIARLFPLAVHGDEGADRELRRLMRDDLLEQRRAGLEALAEVLGRSRPLHDESGQANEDADDARQHMAVREVDLSVDDARLMVGVLNDLRLAIASQLPAAILARTEMPDDDVAERLEVVDHLAALQHLLLTVLDPDAVAAEGRGEDEG